MKTVPNKKFEGAESGSIALNSDQNEILNALCIQRDRATQLINSYLDQCAKVLGVKAGCSFDPQTRTFITAAETAKRIRAAEAAQAANAALAPKPPEEK